ncbi:MAG: hypothetical protein M3460_07715 [Actinomycetota bacterium]|nr:hypothetical protein [Actinomycetota bacterium]
MLKHSGGTIADRGYQGCGYVTPRKKPRRSELSAGDKESNKNIIASPRAGGSGRPCPHRRSYFFP